MKQSSGVFILVLNMCLSTISFAQTAKPIKIASFENFPASANPAFIGKRLSERFMELPHSTFGAFKPTPAKEITYPDACAWYGALTFASRTGDKDLSNRLIKRAELLLKEEAHLIPYAKDVDRAVIGIIPLEVYNQTKDERFLKIGLTPADEQFEQYIDRTAREMIAYLDTLQTPNGLFYHANDVPFYWGRGDGWLAAGMAELLSILPKENIYRPRIMQGYKNMMQTLLKYQDKNGMWHQLLDDPTAWPETSGTAMFTFAFITGVKKGWLDEKTYGQAARKAWISLCGYLDEKNDLREICEGTNKKNDRQYYLDRKRITGDLHGQAPMIWCAMALVN